MFINTKFTRNLRGKSIGLCLLLALAGCTDGAYDLSNIDTTMKVAVDNLKIPVNVSELTIDEIFDIEDMEGIHKIDGRYVYLKDGTVTSDPISVPDFVIKHVQDLTPAIAIEDGKTIVEGKSTDLDLHINSEGVDEEILDVLNFSSDGKLQIVVDFQGGSGSGELTDGRIFVAKGITSTTIAEANPTATNIKYDTSTGILSYDRMPYNNHMATFNIPLNYVNVKELGGFDPETKQLSGVLSPHFLGSSVTGSPQSYIMSAGLDDITVDHISGSISYQFEDLSADDVELSGIPDVLRQEGTNLNLQDTRIYVSFNNPVAGKIYATTTLGIDVVRYEGNEEFVRKFSSDLVTISKDKTINQFEFSEKATTDPYGIYQDITPVKFNGLGQLLGYEEVSTPEQFQRLPDVLRIKAIDPMLPEQKVENFELGSDLGTVNGQYTLYAPLNLSGKAYVAYNDEISGIYSSDLDNLYITTVGLSLTPDTDLPLAEASLTLTPYCIEEPGDYSSEESEAPVTVRDDLTQKVKIEPGKNVTILFDCSKRPLRYLEGIKIALLALPNGKDDIKPTQVIKLKDVKLTVGGEYVN